jgi:Zn-dependent protease
VLVTWSLATGYFPGVLPGLGPQAAWWLGAAGALGLFVSILLHEFSHAIVARQFDMPIRGITLFIFGGVAEMEDEPPSAQAEFFMAIAGPIMSYVLAALFFVVASEPSPGAELPGALFGYLALINAGARHLQSGAGVSAGRRAHLPRRGLVVDGRLCARHAHRCEPRSRSSARC